MTDDTNHTSATPLDRRHFVTSVGLGALLAGLATADAAAADNRTATETANIKAVNDFLADFQSAAPDPVKLAGYFTEDGSYQLHLPQRQLPVVQGQAAVAEQFKTFHTGRTYRFEVLETYAKGPLVVTSRMDTINTDKPGKPAPNIGVFIFLNGKIQQWHSIAYVP